MMVEEFCQYSIIRCYETVLFNKGKKLARLRIRINFLDEFSAVQDRKCIPCGFLVLAINCIKNYLFVQN